MELMKRNWSYLVGILVGGVGGYLYWYHIGCSSGTCPITASPIMSIIWGALMGGIVLNLVFGRKD